MERERKLKKKWKVFEWENFPDNFLIRNANQSGPEFFSDFNEYAMYCGIARRQTFQEELLYFTCKNDTE